MIGNYNLNCLLYADDSLLLSETKNGLKECIARLSHYAEVWKWSVNFNPILDGVFGHPILDGGRAKKPPHLNFE